MTNITETTDMDPAITAAAMAVAAADDAAQRATAAARKATQAVSDARARQQKLAEERAQIVARRRDGDRRHDDGPVLALLVADIEALDHVIAGLEATAAETTAEGQRAVQSLGFARMSLERAEDQLLETALLANADGLSERLLATLTEMRAVRNRRGGGRLSWLPDPALMALLIAIDAQRVW